MANASWIKDIGTSVVGSYLAGDQGLENTGQLLKIAGDVLGGYFGQHSPGPLGPMSEKGTDFGGAIRDMVYRNLTDTRSNRDEYAASLTPTGRYKKDLRPGMEPVLNEATGNYEVPFTKKADPNNPVQQFLYSHPETIATAAGVIAPSAGALGAGLGLNWLAEGSKPRSDYALAVQNSDQSGGYNPNVEASRASTMYRAALEEQKFRHKMALMDHRQQTATPGTQQYKPGSSSNYTNFQGDIDPYKMVNNIFSTPTPIYK